MARRGTRTALTEGLVSHEDGELLLPQLSGVAMESESSESIHHVKDTSERLHHAGSDNDGHDTDNDVW